MVSHTPVSSKFNIEKVDIAAYNLKRQLINVRQTAEELEISLSRVHSMVHNLEVAIDPIKVIYLRIITLYI